MKLPDQRWQVAIPNPEQVRQLIKTTGLPPLIAQVIINRGIETPDATAIYLNPEAQTLPLPLEEFPDLEISVKLLKNAIATKKKIAICGDYDADGMTSTALLLRVLTHLGADVYYKIPSRMKDGYGINERIVEAFAHEGVGLIITVDNGITAYEPIEQAVKLGLSVIITDHHNLPKKLPPADAILNPKLLRETSPYRGLAGVGVAYILAVTIAEDFRLLKDLVDPLLELFTLGTIADLVPLIGVNRRWLKRGLRKLPQSKLAGVQALMQVTGISEEQKQLKPDDIGFRLGPRINAVGRIGEPQIAIELLTTDDYKIALERAMQCEQINSERKAICEQIELEAIHLVENTPILWKRDRILVVIKSQWHHGVIGIVASRLVERYGVPVFIGTYEENSSKIRGSARGIKEFNVVEGLDFCQDILEKYGGHKAAGGFSLSASKLETFKQKLSFFAHQCLLTKHLKPLVMIDAQANLKELTSNLYQSIDQLQPWGIGNPTPIFWTPNIYIIEQKIVGKNHIKLGISQNNYNQVEMEAIVWRWGKYFPLPKRVDIAYKLTENYWNGNSKIELEVVGIRLPLFPLSTSDFKLEIFQYQGRNYQCSFSKNEKELRIRNDKGKVLAVKRGQQQGLLGTTRENSQKVDITQPRYFNLIKTAMEVLNL
ncbi:single-stranded-DNA-specific exonuclease RecJ [cyanobacterium endosymbiont of Epithemia clementina EcSB]|uniref:single-stranded-DNA-specific exonuclease RecJ n=1 Tax=cyanobacterium endosymbiont of Epithemia clementina EcSB TaxID=3034674 RepID=UPI0024815DFC|nr:single-stranded-DNA-specific exonuclease RecJ [cyanobacterium endosymbiont of Epithemia clementina EcSB]WGT67891.1 single-stranded-DNA-specific exonuclease RecJ [cyanobacterium endosymbiont of Epithemia clementina EcSB]